MARAQRHAVDWWQIAIRREGEFDSIELDGDPTFVHSTLVSGPKTLPVRFNLR